MQDACLLLFGVEKLRKDLIDHGKSLPWTWLCMPIPLPLNFSPLRGDEVGICVFKRLTSHEIFFAKKNRIEYLPKEAGKECFALRQEINKMLFHERTMKTRSALPALRVCP